MATRPTGTILDEDRLLELREATETAASALGIEVTPVADYAGASSGDHIDWDVDDYGDEPMLVFAGIEEAAAGDAPYPRRLREEDGEIVAPVPDPLVRADPPAGLGLDLEEYDADDPLLFDAITAGETIGLVPVRFDDGRSYRAEPLPGVADDSDPVAEGIVEHEGRGDPTPRPETTSAPIDADVLESALDETERDVAETDVVGLLEAIERLDLVGTGDHVAGVPPLSADHRAVCLLEADVWTDRLGPELEANDVDVDPDALAVARAVHERQASVLIDAAGTTEYRGLEDEYALIVTDASDTAEWDVSEPGTADRSETN
ncbi:hypothetical protein [Natrinema salsiterrestre]|uniref:Uncharacterized protein n=1 Tax=Natrinema salsiterrestre TaxID=2950540 RepID=A0A9Q4Q3S1_9EURY|nr:hypothetical protein [Natrinema salsiterrestre]MDF9746523.1 hypothetical protein [Natrinema salsiterrestre]